MMKWDITTEEYIQRAKAVHGDRYGYELCEYKDRNTKITVTCKVHGPFLIHPYTHIRLGCGCMKCANDKMKKTEVHHGNHQHKKKYQKIYRSACF